MERHRHGRFLVLHRHERRRYRRARHGRGRCYLLAQKANCAAVIAIGQCATFGGYPGCKPPISAATAGFNSALSQTGAQGTYDFLLAHASAAAAAKVVNVPGCPTNPWWFVLTVALILVEYNQGVFAGQDGPLGILTSTGAIKATALSTAPVVSRPSTAPPSTVPRARGTRTTSTVASPLKPGDAGCLQKIGCKGPYTKSLCGLHGWNALQPENKNLATASDYDLATSVYPITGGKKPSRGSHCTSAGHPCMACTEKGYPDSFVPFVVR